MTMIAPNKIWFIPLATVLALTSNLVMAKKPPQPDDDEPEIVATTTDQDFLESVLEQESSQTAFALAIDTGSAGTHYRYKVGVSETTDPNDLSNYSYWYDKTTPLILDISDVPDGAVVLCLQACQQVLDKWGSVKRVYYQDVPTVYSWTKISSTHISPTFTWTEPDGNNDVPDANGMLSLSWEVDNAETGATIALFYGDTYMNNLIDVVDVDASGAAQSLVWDTAGVSQGIYFLCASVTDSQTTTDFWSPFPVIVGSPPAADWTWQPETIVGVGAVIGTNYQVEMDGSGHAMAVGSYQDERGWVFNYSVYDGASWSEAGDLIAASSPNVWMRPVPQLLAIGVNQYLLVYAEESPSQHLFGLLYDGENWEAVPQVIDETFESAYGLVCYDDDPFGKYNFRAASSTDGTAMVVWREVQYGTICTRFFNGLCWEPDESHLTGTQPTIAADDNGNFMVAYLHGETSSPADWHVYSMHYDGSAAAWSSEMVVDIDSLVSWPEEGAYLIGENTPVQLAGAGDNKFVAVYTSWPQSGGEPRSDMYGCVFNGMTWEWENKTLLDNQSGMIPAWEDVPGNGITRVVMAPNGTALVAWTQHNGANLVVYGSSFDGTAWATAPTPLSFNTHGDAKTMYGGLTIDDQGNGIVAFYDTPHSTNYTVVKTHYIAGSGWQLQAVDDESDRPTDREALTDGTMTLAKCRLAGQWNGKAILLHNPYMNDTPLTFFSSLEYGD